MREGSSSRWHRQLLHGGPGPGAFSVKLEFFSSEVGTCLRECLLPAPHTVRAEPLSTVEQRVSQLWASESPRRIC